MLSLFLLVACGTPELAVSIPFSATVDGAPFACGETYDGIGTSAVSITALDFRFYVYDVALVTEEGDVVPVALEQDGRWQYEDVALIDLEDGSGDCETGSPDQHAALTGTVPDGDYHGLSFQLGVPADLNHLDAATAPAPLNDAGLWWAWTSGYKYARIDVATPNNPSYFFHLGATDCTGDSAAGYACALDNLAPVTLDEFHLGEATATIDLAAFYADSDLEATPDFVSDFVSGCMAFAGDPECEPLFERLGMPWEGVTDPPEQTFFTVTESQ
jgi:uncharacterized repeat protein (TIGR04052 family)